MLVAKRDFSLFEHVIRQGDVIPAELQAQIPVGRLRPLVDQRFVEEIPTSGDEHIDLLLAEYAQTVEELQAKARRLQAQIDVLTAREASDKVEVV